MWWAGARSRRAVHRHVHWLNLAEHFPSLSALANGEDRPSASGFVLGTSGVVQGCAALTSRGHPTVTLERTRMHTANGAFALLEGMCLMPREVPERLSKVIEAEVRVHRVSTAESGEWSTASRRRHLSTIDSLCVISRLDRRSTRRHFRASFAARTSFLSIASPSR